MRPEGVVSSASPRSLDALSFALSYYAVFVSAGVIWTRIDRASDSDTLACATARAAAGFSIPALPARDA